MSTPQERIAEYLQKHYSGGEGWPPMHHAAEICKLVAPVIADREAAYAQMRKALVGMVAWYETAESDQPEKLPIRIRACEKALSTDCGKELLDRLNKLEKENAELNKALALKLDAMPSGLSAGQSKVLEDKLKTAASMLRYAVYERTPLGDKWIDHFDVERQKAITEFLASVEGNV